MTSSKPVGAVDFTYLEGFVGGDKAIVREVLGLFRQQAETWAPGLDAADPGWRDLVHTMKGASRGIGANQLGDLCAAAEAQGESGLLAIRAGLDVALADIAAYEAMA